MKNKVIRFFILGPLLFFACTQNPSLKIIYPSEGNRIQEMIILNDYIASNSIHNACIDSIRFGLLDSIWFEYNDPDQLHFYQTRIKLDFTKEIQPYSPEYYAVFTGYFVSKAIRYYDKLFQGKINFTAQKKYKTIDVDFGDFPLLTNPNHFIIQRNTNISPAFFYQEIGKRAFLYLEDSLGIKFRGNSFILMGLLEYFTTSCNNAALIGEGYLPANMYRDASKLYKYPPDNSYNLDKTLQMIKEAFPEKMADSKSNMAKYYNAFVEYNGKMTHRMLDNERSGMIITGMFWRIREQIGQKICDKLLAETILDLNDYMDNRGDYYPNDKGVMEKIEWYDLYYGLMEKDLQLYKGMHHRIIRMEFERTGFPVKKVKWH